MAVDTQGLPHAIGITTADVTDRQGALQIFIKENKRLSGVKSVLVDGGYSGASFTQSVEEILGAQVQVAKRSALHTFSVIPERWVDERSLGWLEKCRRLWKNCERTLHASLHRVILAFISLLLRRT